MKHTGNVFKLLLALSILCFSISGIMAGSNVKAQVPINFKIPTNADGVNRVMVNSKLLELDVVPTIINGRMLVPLRAIFEELGAQVKWEEKTRTVTGTKDSVKVVLQIDNSIALINDRETTLEVPATIIDGRTLVPVRFIAESLGADVSWDENTRTAIVITNSFLSSVPDASTYIGGSGDNDGVVGSAIQADGTVVVAANISDSKPGNLNAILLNNSTAGTSGAILRLSSDGSKVLSVTRVANEVFDMAMDGEDNICIAAGTDGLIKLNSKADTVVWRNDNGGSCERVDTSNDGYVAGLKGAFEISKNSGAPAVYVYNAEGKVEGSFSGYRNTYDVAIDGKLKSVYLTGFNQTKGPSGNPVQIAYLVSKAYDGAVKWKGYDWSGAQVDSPNTNNMADTRGVRVSVGQDGYLYCGFMVAGGNHIFRYDPYDLKKKVQIAGGDKYHEFYNTKSEHKTFFAKYNPENGEYLLGQQLTARLGESKKNAGNSCRIDKGDIKADAMGRVYVVGSSACYMPYTFDPVPDEYGGGSFILIMSSDFKERLYCGRISSSDQMNTVAVRSISGDSSPSIVFGGKTKSTSVWLKNSIQTGKGRGEYDGMFAVKTNMPVK